MSCSACCLTAKGKERTRQAQLRRFCRKRLRRLRRRHVKHDRLLASPFPGVQPRRAAVLHDAQQAHRRVRSLRRNLAHRHAQLADDAQHHLRRARLRRRGEQSHSSTRLELSTDMRHPSWRWRAVRMDDCVRARRRHARRRLLAQRGRVASCVGSAQPEHGSLDVAAACRSQRRRSCRALKAHIGQRRQQLIGRGSRSRHRERKARGKRARVRLRRRGAPAFCLRSRRCLKRLTYALHCVASAAAARASEMSHRRKHVLQSVADECPSIDAGQRLLRVCGPRGSNILEVRARALGAPAAAPLTLTRASPAAAASLRRLRTSTAR